MSDRLTFGLASIPMVSGVLLVGLLQRPPAVALEVALGEVQLGAGSSGAEVMRQFAHGHADRIDYGLLTSEPPPEAGCTT